MENEQSNPHLDSELLQSYLDSLGKGVVEKMFTLYRQQVKIYLNDIEVSQLNDSIPGWEEHCHKMKGAAASVGMCKLHRQLKLVEKTGAPQKQKAVLLEELKLTNEQGIIAFSDWLETVEV